MTRTSREELVARLRAAGCVFAEDEAALLTATASDPDELEAMVVRRLAGEPLEVVVGFADFCGVRVLVSPGVFVPRARTALMVRVAAEHLTAQDRPVPLLVDLCCGTGAVGLAVRSVSPDVELFAAEVDPDAVACARLNVEPAGGTVLEGDLFAALPHRLRGRVDVLTCNAPYVPTRAIATMPPEARDHEHRVALDGGDDGLDVVRRVLAGAPEWLRPAGLVVVEVGTAQVQVALAVGRSAGLATDVVTDPEVGATVVRGALPDKGSG